MQKTTMALAIAMLLLAGCGAPAGGAAGQNGPSETDADKAAVEERQPVPDEADADQQEQAAAEDAGDQPEAGSAEPPTPVKPLYRMNDVYRFEPIGEETSAKAVLLTFDDGPKEEEQLTSMLDTLDKHQAKAIFFVNGYRVERKPELLTPIYERGHAIGNHAWDHIDLKKEADDVVARQIGDVQRIVEELTGEAPRFFRPPFGSGGEAVRAAAAREGLLYMTWSNGSLDWDASTKNKPEAVIANVMEQLHPGANILMHELPWTAEALDDLLTGLEEQGYGFIDPAAIELPAPPEADG